MALFPELIFFFGNPPLFQYVKRYEIRGSPPPPPFCFSLPMPPPPETTYGRCYYLREEKREALNYCARISVWEIPSCVRCEHECVGRRREVPYQPFTSHSPIFHMAKGRDFRRTTNLLLQGNPSFFAGGGKIRQSLTRAKEDWEETNLISGGKGKPNYFFFRELLGRRPHSKNPLGRNPHFPCEEEFSTHPAFPLTKSRSPLFPFLTFHSLSPEGSTFYYTTLLCGERN